LSEDGKRREWKKAILAWKTEESGKDKGRKLD
jgi:hypothetical protein